MRHAIRGLLRTPGFSAVVILLLAVGIGANVLIFSFVDSLLLRPLPVKEPERLVQLMRLRPKNIPDTEFSYLKIELLRQRSKALANVFGSEPFELAFESSGRSENLSGLLVSPGHDAMLGVRPAVGRLLNDAEERDPSAHSVVLSYSFWQRAFAGSRDVVGREIRLRGLPFTVVGVLPRGFNGMSIDDAVDVEMPMTAMLRWVKATRVDFAPTQIYARLAPGVTIEQARAEFETLSPGLLESELAMIPNLKQADAASDRDRAKAHKPWMEDASGGVSTLRKQFSLAVEVLMGAVGLLLLLVCANVGGLLLARGEARRQEIAIRLSLGASRWSIIGLALGEGLVLSCIGLLGALLVARLGSPWLIAQLPSRRPLALDLTPDWRVTTFCVVACVACALAVSVGPAIRALGVDLIGMMGRGGTRTRRSRAAYGFVAVQVMMATILTITGALLVRTLDRLRSADLGFAREHLIVMQVNARTAGVKTDGQLSVFQAILEGMRQIPGVESVSLAQGRLMQGLGMKNSVGAAGTRIEPSDFLNTSTNMVSPEYLDTMRMRLLEGRVFSEADRNAKDPAPAVVTRSFARRFFGTEHAVGKRYGSGINTVAKPEYEVIGVVGDTKYRSMREQTPPVHYTLLNDDAVKFADGLSFHVRTKGDTAGVIAALRNLLARTGPGIVPASIATMEQEIDRSLWREVLIATLATVFAGLSAFLAAVGLYGMLSHAIRRRTRELGIRIALGATVGRIVNLVARDVVACVLPGLMVGLAAYLACSRLMVPLLYGVDPLDGLLVSGAMAFLIAVAVVAGLVPARRAVTIQPSEALRDQ